LEPHVTTQFPLHFTSQFAVSLHVTVLSAPKFSLQSADAEQVPTDWAPDFSSHFAEPAHTMLLPSPPLPLHSVPWLQTIDSAAVEEPLHLVSEAQSNEQAAPPQVAWQSSEQVHAFAPPQVQVPVHAAGVPGEVPPSSLPHPAKANAREAAKNNDASRFGVPMLDSIAGTER
jgi:hypothetical protein